jgi:hypothetical protein
MQETKDALLSGHDNDRSALRAEYERAMAQHNARMQQVKVQQHRWARWQTGRRRGRLIHSSEHPGHDHGWEHVLSLDNSSAPDSSTARGSSTASDASTGLAPLQPPVTAGRGSLW